MMTEPLPRLYTDLASWFPLLTAPADYAEEAAFFLRAFNEAADTPLRTLLELGSGGGTWRLTTSAMSRVPSSIYRHRCLP